VLQFIRGNTTLRGKEGGKQIESKDDKTDGGGFAGIIIAGYTAYGCLCSEGGSGSGAGASPSSVTGTSPVTGTIPGPSSVTSAGQGEDGNGGYYHGHDR